MKTELKDSLVINVFSQPTTTNPLGTRPLTWFLLKKKHQQQSSVVIQVLIGLHTWKRISV